VKQDLWTFAELFEGRIFEVPDYQRGYAWEAPQLRDLVEDLAALRGDQRHYTGTVVLHPQDKEEQDEALRKLVVHHIVDGQQRLTTLTILLSVLKRELESVLEVDHPACKELARHYLWIRGPNSAIPTPRLRLHGELGTYFRRSVLADVPGEDGPRTTAAKRLTEARRFFQQWLSEERQKRDATDGREWLLQLRAKVTERLVCTLFPVESEGEVGVIFEVMNNRGRPLSELDKVKNYLLYVAAKLEANELAIRVNETWGKLLRLLMEGGLTEWADEDRLLRTHWLLTQDHDDRNWEGYRSVKARFDLRHHVEDEARFQLQTDIAGYLRTLEDTAIALRDIDRPDRDGAFTRLSSNGDVRDTLRLWTKRLHRIGILRAFRPFLAGVRMRSRTPDTYLAALRACERFSFLVYGLAGLRSHTGRTRFNSMGRRVFEGELGVDEAIVQVESLTGWYCKRETYDSFWKLDEENPRDFYRWGALRYLLYEYELHCVDDKNVRVMWSTLQKGKKKTTIEHILPQDPSHAYWRKRFTEDDVRIYLHDLGNLALTEDNSSYGNKPYCDKLGEPGIERRCYCGSLLKSEQNLANWKDWTPEAIRERRSQLVEWASDRWPRPVEEELDEDEVAAEAELPN